MALYEYRCGNCGKVYEAMRPMADADKPAKCPQCGSEQSERLISGFASTEGYSVKGLTKEPLRGKRTRGSQ